MRRKSELDSSSDFLSNPCERKFKLGLGFLFLIELLLAPRRELGLGSKKNPCPSSGLKKEKEKSYRKTTLGAKSSSMRAVRS